jgi:hypothetical protein
VEPESNAAHVQADLMPESVFLHPWQSQPPYRPALKNPGFWRLVDAPYHAPYGTNITRSYLGTARRGIGRGGPALDFPVAGDYLSYGANPALQLSTMTGVAVVEVSSAAVYTTIFNTNLGAAFAAGFVIRVNNTGTVSMLKQDVTAWGTTTKTVKRGTGVSTVAWSYNNVTGLTRIAIDGTLSSATSVQTFPHGIVCRNKYYSGADATQSSVHKQYLLALSAYDTLSNSQLISLSLNPWQIYKPRERRIWTPDPVVGGSTSIPVFANHYRNQGIM